MIIEVFAFTSIIVDCVYFLDAKIKSLDHIVFTCFYFFGGNKDPKDVGDNSTAYLQFADLLTFVLSIYCFVFVFSIKDTFS